MASNFTILHCAYHVICGLESVQFLNLIPEVLHGVRATNHYIQLAVRVFLTSLLLNVVRNIEYTYSFLSGGNRQKECHKRIEGDGNPIARLTMQSRLILPVEQVSHNRLVTHEMLVPGLVRGGLLRLALWRVLIFNVRLLALAVEIFAEEVQDCVDALVGVMLLIAFKLGGVLT